MESTGRDDNDSRHFVAEKHSSEQNYEDGNSKVVLHIINDHGS